MSRLPRFCPPGMAQHIIQRGNNRQACFAAEQDFAAYACWLKEYAQAFSVAIHAWVFMTNHVHLLATPASQNSIACMMQALGRRYVRYFNYRCGRTGTLWEGRYKSCLVQTGTYLLHCQRYIELNPVRAGMVRDPAEYPWSSYRSNGMGVESALCSPHELYLGLGASKAERLQAYRALFKAHVEGSLLNEIRDTVNQGMALGTERFKRDLEARHGRRVRPAPIGRPRKSVI